MKASELVANELSVKLPDDYKEFLDGEGYTLLDKLGLEIYGYKQGFDIKKIPCVIAATKINQKAYRLRETEIVISHTGYEELITILDCKDGKVIELGLDGVRIESSNGFKGWLTEIKRKNELTAD